MHDVGERPDRGQILLISALLIAVLFVGLAVVVNSAVYAENRATREATSSAAVLADHPVTQDRLSRTIGTANYHSDFDGYDARHELLRENLSKWDTELQAQSATDGTYWGSNVVDSKNGTRVSQDVRQSFMPAEESILDPLDPLGLGDKTNWIIANDSQVRGFEMNVTRNQLATRDPTLVGVLTNILNDILTGSSIFWVESDVQEGDGDFWRLYLLEDGSNVTAFVVEYDGGTGSIEAECSANGSMVNVRVSAGELVGNEGTVPCPSMRNLAGSESRDMHFAGGDEVEGTYKFIVHKKESRFRNELEDRYGSLLDAVLCLLICDAEDNIYHQTKADGHPYTTPAIWNTTVELTYQDDRVRYSRTVSVPTDT